MTNLTAWRQEQSRSANGIVPVILDLVQPVESVLDLGCGDGHWLTAFVGFGVPNVEGVDITLNKSHDLAKPFYAGRRYDLVLCLEVGEHLPPESAATLVATCIRHSDNVVFSAAVPGQEGDGHINCQPHEYWHLLFRDWGYDTKDVIRPLIAARDVSPWYRNNMFLYKRP